jgi:hypothetical protein
MRAFRPLWALAALGFGGWLACGTQPAAAQEPTEEQVAARAFEVHYHPLADAADLIESLLSESGVITLHKRLSTLLVEDRTSILDRVEALLAGWDLPPRNVEITLTLFLGTELRGEDPQAPQADYGLSKEVRGVMEKLSNFMKWTTYEPLGSRSVIGTAGDTVVADLTDEFRVVLVLESVHRTHGTVKFEKLQLQRITLAEDGTEKVENLYTAGAVIPPDRLTVVGAATGPRSKRALFLALQTRPR